MPQFFNFDVDYEPSRYRDNPDFHGVNLAGEEELLVLDDMTIEAYHRTRELGVRVQRWLEANHLWDQMQERWTKAGRESEMVARFGQLQGLVTGEPHAGSPDYLLKVDPIYLAKLVESWASQLHDAIEQVHQLQKSLALFDPRAELFGAETLRRLCYLGTLLTYVHQLMLQRMLERIAHGIPQWDHENGVERELEAGVPRMRDESEPEATELRAQVDEVFQRLMSGWGDFGAQVD